MQNANSPDSPAIALVQRPSQRMADHIQKASTKTGVPFDFLLAQAHQESKLDPNAQNSKSSASGLFQFTAGTWLSMIQKHGAEYGLDKYAQAIGKTANGQYYVKDKALKAEILEMRKDPALSSYMAGEYAKDNGKFLQKKLGRDVSAGDLYMAHFLGAGGALKVLRSVSAEQTADNTDLSQAAKLNPDVFGDQKSGKQRSMDDVYRSLGKQYKHAMAEAASLIQKMRPEVDLANLRPEARPDEGSGDGSTTLASAGNADNPFVLDETDLSSFGLFPVAIPSRPSNASPTPTAPHFPVTRTDTDTTRELLNVSTDEKPLVNPILSMRYNEGDSSVK